MHLLLVLEGFAWLLTQLVLWPRSVGSLLQLFWGSVGLHVSIIAKKCYIICVVCVCVCVCLCVCVGVCVNLGWLCSLWGTK